MLLAREFDTLKRTAKEGAGRDLLAPSIKKSGGAPDGGGRCAGEWMGATAPLGVSYAAAGTAATAAAGAAVALRAFRRNEERGFYD